MGIDEWRRHQVAFRIDFTRGLDLQSGSDGGDAALLNRDIDMLPAVRQGGVADHKVHRRLHE
ncbi:hypothetical protein D3C72_2579110 [compost metagenome]